MKALLTLVMILGVLLLPRPLWAQCAAPEAGEVQCTTTLSNLVAVVNGQLMMTGVREVEVRNLVLDPNQPNPFLSTNPMTTPNPLTQISNNLSEGQKVDIRTTDGQRFRVQNENGQLRVRMRDVGSLNQMQADALAMFLSDKSFGRVEIRGDGFRVERRGAEVKNEVEADHSIRGRERAERERMEHARPEKIEKMERIEKIEKIEKPERIGKVDRHGR